MCLYGCMSGGICGCVNSYSGIQYIHQYITFTIAVTVCAHMHHVYKQINMIHYSILSGLIHISRPFYMDGKLKITCRFSSAQEVPTKL